MLWPMPDIPQRQRLTSPNYPRWIIVFFIMAAAGSVMAIFPGKATSYVQVILYGTLPAGLLWFCLFGLALHRYERASNTAIRWELETQKTQQHWQRWSRNQLTVVGNVALSPETTGIRALLENAKDIPAFPDKARCLATGSTELLSRLKYIDKELEKQCPGYRHYLNRIVVLHSRPHQQEAILESVIEQWDLFPEYLSCAESIYDVLMEDKSNGMTIVLSIQDWHAQKSDKYSEFITAQIIIFGSFLTQNTFPVTAGIGRVLTSDTLAGALDLLFEYNKLDNKNLNHVWLSRIDADDRAILAQYVAATSWPLSAKHPFISLDFSFGPPGPLMFPVAISLLSGASMQTGKIQLLISKGENNSYQLCLITRELFL